jgi:hypothetical protein
MAGWDKAIWRGWSLFYMRTRQNEPEMVMEQRFASVTAQATRTVTGRQPYQPAAVLRARGHHTARRFRASGASATESSRRARTDSHYITTAVAVRTTPTSIRSKRTAIK